MGAATHMAMKVISKVPVISGMKPKAAVPPT